MTPFIAIDFRAGALNLLQNCAGVTAGDKLVIVFESPSLGWYDEVPHRVAAVARELGVSVTLRETGGPRNDAFDETRIAGKGWDTCIYFARVADQIRFDEMADDRTRVVCYASTVDALASPYGCTTHSAMLDIKRAIDSVVLAARSVRVTCSLGTDLSGRVMANEAAGDVMLQGFPMGVHTPVAAARFSGTVALARYLTPTGSKVYEPPWIVINRPVLANITGGAVTDFVGTVQDVSRIEAHYDAVARRFGLQADAVHSWHAGIHPGRSFSAPAAANPDRWSNTVFTSPRFVHFHTCGVAPPGEICWMTLDPTISVDGIALWEDGVLHPERCAATSECLARWPELSVLFGLPKTDVGVSQLEGAKE